MAAQSISSMPTFVTSLIQPFTVQFSLFRGVMRGNNFPGAESSN